MRNLKKVLSLSLALVMLLGMMVMGAGAAEFKDAGSIKNEEAVKVVSGIGVLMGDEKGNFNPEGTLTRAEAAVVIAKLDLGEAFGNLATTNASTFTDVPANHWAKAYIDYCAARGLIVGSAGKFMPNDKVSGVQFGLMVARVLGYEDSNEELGGAGWEVKAAALARKANLTIDVTLGSQPMTRDEMAQVAFNALKADMVEYDGRAININGVYIPAGKAKPVENASTTLTDHYNRVADGKMQLCEQKFPKLSYTANGETDPFGRDAVVWKVGKTEVAKVEGGSATVTYTAKTSANQITKDLKGCNWTTLHKDSVFIDGTAEDSSSSAQSAVITDAASLRAKTGNGTLVEVYVDDKDITKVVVVSYDVSTLTSVTEKNGKTTYKFEGITPTRYNDEDNTNVVLKGDVEEGDVVTIADVGGKYYVYPTTSFDGNQTAKKTATDNVTLTIGGEKYVLADAVGNVAGAAEFTNSDKDATYFVDQYGLIVKAKDIDVKAPEYAMIVDAVGAKTNATLDNATGYTAEVRAVLADGTVQDFALALKKTGADGTGTGNYLYAGKVNLQDASDPETYAIQTNLNSYVKGKVMAYTLNDDEQMVLTGLTSASGTMNKAGGAYSYTNGTTAFKGETSNTHSGATALFNSKTVFVLYSVDGKKVTAEAPVTGVANLKIDTDTGVTTGKLVAVISTASEDNVGRATASLVFLRDASAAAEKDYVYVKAADNLVGENYEFTGIAPDGTEVAVWKKGPSNGVADGLYEYNVDDGKLGSKVEGVAASGAAPEKNKVYKDVVAETDGEMLKVNETWINISETPVNFVASGVDELVDGCKLLIVMDSASAKKIEGIYVVEKAPASVAAADLGTTGHQEITEDTEVASGDVTLDTGETVTVKTGKTLTVNGNLTLNQGSLVLEGTAKLVVTGDLTITDGTFTDAAGTEITVTGATTITPNSKTIAGKLKTAGLTTSDGATISGNVETTTLAVNAAKVTVGGTLKATGAATLGADVDGTGTLTVASFSDAATSAAHAKTTTVEITAAATAATLEAVPGAAGMTLIVGAASSDTTTNNSAEGANTAKFFKTPGTLSSNGTSGGVAAAVSLTTNKIDAGTYAWNTDAINAGVASASVATNQAAHAAWLLQSAD